MNFALVALLSITAASLAGTVIMLRGLRSAPEGFQDETGFHFGRAQQATEAEHRQAA